MKIDTYVPVKEKIVAAQWPKNPTAQDCYLLHRWLETDVIISSNNVVTIQHPNKTVKLNGTNWIVRDDDGFHVYKEKDFNTKFVRV